MKTGGVTPVVPLAPSPYDHAGDIHMFYWTRFLYRRSNYWTIGFFKCPNDDDDDDDDDDDVDDNDEDDWEDDG